MKYPTYNGNPNLVGSATRLFDSGMKNIQGAAKSYGDRVKNRAIGELMSKPLGEGETADEYSNNMRTGLSNIDGIDPLMALNLTNAASAPIFRKEKIIRDEAAAEKLFGFNEKKEENTQTYRTDTLKQKGDVLEETVRSNKATEGDFGTVTTDDGVTWTYDKNTGAFEKKKGSTGNLASKFIETRDVKQVDPVTGAETTKTYTIDKRKPGIDYNTGLPIPDSVKYQQLTQADKDKSDSIQSTMSLLADAVGGKFDPATVGNVDRFAAWLDNTLAFDWGKDTEKTIINSGRWNILGGKLVKTMYGGNASDADRESVFQFVPQSGDSETTYKAKAKEFAKLLSGEHRLFTERVNRSNPGYMPSIGETIQADDGKTYKIVK